MYYYETQWLDSLLIIFLFVWLPCAFFTVNVAANKDCYVIPWFLGGFFFGPIALISIAGMPDRRSRKYMRLIAEKLEAIEPVGRGKEWEPTPSDWSEDKK